jgi:F0F1-type ATP synthase assembly protein I
MKLIVVVSAIAAFLLIDATLQIVGFSGGGAGFLAAAVTLEIWMLMTARKARNARKAR